LTALLDLIDFLAMSFHRYLLRHSCAAYFIKHPQKSLWLRQDTLAQALHLGNPRPHPDALTMVVEQTGGLLTAAVAERLAGVGRLLHLHVNAVPNLNAMRCVCLADFFC
jgi:tRNA (adenine-N(1)-)-methyltransferase non-catalytic subunit